MTSKLKRTLRRNLKRPVHNRTFVISTVAVLLCAGLVSYAMYMENRRLAVNPDSYRPLLELVASVESKGNYNAHFGNAHNTAIDFTNMSIRDVQRWQAETVAQGSASSAVGRYQIIDTTLRGLVEQLGLEPSQKFDKETQDRLAMALLENRGGEKYVNHELTAEEYAANLSMEWAALPKVLGDNPQASYYDGDGLNKSLVSREQVIEAVEAVAPKL